MILSKRNPIANYFTSFSQICQFFITPQNIESQRYPARWKIYYERKDIAKQVDESSSPTANLDASPQLVADTFHKVGTLINQARNTVAETMDRWGLASAGELLGKTADKAQETQRNENELPASEPGRLLLNDTLIPSIILPSTLNTPEARRARALTTLESLPGYGYVFREAVRREQAKYLNLDPNTSWEDINNASLKKDLLPTIQEP